VLSILKWTQANIIKDTKGKLAVVDDHILNIIIRGYGENDQFQDVFTTLSTYSGVPAFWRKVYEKKGRVWIPLSFVKLSGRWCVFDAYYGVYFMNRQGGIASVDDIIADKSLVQDAQIGNFTYSGVPYKEFYYNMDPLKVPTVLRAEKQMPFKRIWFELSEPFDRLRVFILRAIEESKRSVTYER